MRVSFRSVALCYMPTTRAFISSQIKFHEFLTHILRLKSYLYPLRHFGFPLDQNGFNVCGDFAPREDLVPPRVFGTRTSRGDVSVS